MLRLLIGVALALALAGVAQARDLFVINGHTYSFDEIAIPAADLAAYGPVKTGAEGLQYVRERTLRDRAETRLIAALPYALALPCDLEVEDAEIDAYAQWWTQRTIDQAKRIESDLIRGKRPLPLLGATPVQEVQRPTGYGTDALAWSRLLRMRPARRAGDHVVRVRALREVGRQKQISCLMRTYPRDPFGAGPSFLAGPDRVRLLAPLTEDEGPADGCLQAVPDGAVWDLIKAAEDKGVLAFKDPALAKLLSTRHRPRPIDVQYRWPQPCWTSPPWDRRVST